MSREPVVKPRTERELRTWLFNPFQYVAGWPALLIGLAVMLAAGALAAVGGGRFDGTLDFHQLLPGMQSPPWAFLVDAAAAWLPLSCMLWLGGRLVARSRFRAVDVFGTQALARFPTLLTAVACLPPGVRRYTQYLLALTREALNSLAPGAAQTVPEAPPVDVGALDAVAFVACMVAVLVALVWMVALMYRAFAVSCNVRGGKAVAVFVVALVLAEALSKLIIILTAA
jgi:hypothetical protein